VEHKPILTYDEEGDILYISFHPGEKGTGVELNQNILLRFNREEKMALGLTLFNYSVLIQMTETGPRSFPLTGLADIPQELRDIVTHIITHPPVNHYLKTLTYTPSLAESLPITLVERPETVAAL
jgi:uncharacterized protein YuzE